MPRQYQTRRLRPVRTLLNRLVLACLLPGIVGSAIFLFAEYRQERARLSEQTADIAQSLGKEIDTYMLRTQALALALSRAKGLTAGDSGAFTARAAQAISAAGLGSNVALYSKDGSRLLGIVEHGPAALPSASGADAAARVFRYGKPVVSNLHHDRAANRSFVAIHVPVLRDGQVAYSLGIDIPSGQLNAMLLARHLRPGWLASLIDPRGLIAARSRNLDLLGQPASDKLRAAIALSSAGMIDSVTRDGVRNLTTFWRSPQTGYTTIVGVPRADLVGPLRWRLAGLAATVALLFAAGMLLARRVSRHIAHSFQALIEPAMALGSSRRPASAPVFLSESAEVRDAIERAAILLEEREAALRAQQEELEQFKFFSEHANHMLLLLDDRGRIRYANGMTRTRLGYTNDELLAMTLYQIDLPTSVEGFERVFAQCRVAPPPPFERVYTCKDGSSFPVEISATVLQHRGEWLMHVAPRDIGERRKAEQAVRWAASHDALTGVANRSLALDFLQQCLDGVRASAASGALLCIDLDRFKPVNDLYGHEAGDRVLQEVARRIQSCLGAHDLLARFGGDEFVVILVGRGQAPGHVDDADDVARAIIDALEESIRVGKIEVNLSACIGISLYPEHGDLPGALVHAADLAMLQVKQGGGRGFAYYVPAMDEQAQFVLNVERRLQAALDLGGLALHYQPIVDLASGAMVGIEALVRLEDGLSPALGPAAFIPVAEACGLVAPLGGWVACEACRQQVAWKAAGMRLGVSVNVSALQFRRPQFADQVRDLIAASGVDPHDVTIELTETAVMDNLAQAIATLHELRGLGVRIALDDFGTGYSSLASLSSLPLDKLKIDQSFVRRIDSDHTSRAVIDAVIALGKSLSLELVAEGIETPAAWHYLRERGCQLGQGYYFSRPLPAAVLSEWHEQATPVPWALPPS
jgi:diguanylate cyclase (GGDEF)-like protein/PAS domain S-box-containing protein